MRFRVRFADQIVGAFTVIAILALIFVIFMLGSRQRWFARDFLYTSYFESAAGLSLNMTVQYKGFTIGNIKSLRLTDDDRVEATIAIYDNYVDRVREGSLVDLLVSPIGLGNQFLFYAGLGKQLEEGGLIPSLHSPEAEVLLHQGLAYIPTHDDSITLLISRANTILDNVNRTVVQINEAIAGNDTNSLGRILGSVDNALGTVAGLAEDVDGSFQSFLEYLRPVIRNLESLSAALADPDNSVAALLDTEGQVYTGLASSAQALSGVLHNLEKTSAFLPTQLPQVAALLSQLRAALQTADDVLIALSNNPLLKKGIPDHVKTQSTGAGSRDIPF